MKALLVEYAELRSRLLRLFANLRVLQTLQALPDPIVRPPGLDEKFLDADLFVETYVFVAHAEALGTAPATMDGFLKKLEDVVKYFHFVAGKLPRQ